MKIGETIRKVRLERGATLEEIALAAGTDASNLSRIERGRQRFTPELLAGIAQALRVPVSALYMRAEQDMAEYVVGGAEAGSPEPAAGSGRAANSAATDSTELLTRYGRLSPEHRRLVMEFVRMVGRWQKAEEGDDKETVRR